uniref:Reverse transcriptase/retrotransposon-derived protein RNase H-like domain-containing protein n=1 Tax=Megaselia scalaris TaxID=36166 RepID=T1H506_MEGSC
MPQPKNIKEVESIIDASEYGVGVPENKEHPISFAPKALTSTERNYRKKGSQAIIVYFCGRKGFYALILMHYDFEIYYKSGKINYVAMSRLSVQNDKSPTLLILTP